MDQFQVLYLLTVGQISGEAYTVKSLRQDMLQKHSDEVGALHSQVFHHVSVGIVFVSESDMSIGDLFNPAVCDCCPERIACQIADGVAPAVECLADERKPRLFEEGINKRLPSQGILQVSCTGKIQRAVSIHLFESV